MSDKIIPRLLTGLAFAVAIVLLALFPKWTVDDAFISYRYGMNLVAYGELVWNVGEEPVEGYTGILLPLLAAFSIFVNLPPEEFVRVLSVLAFLLSGFLVYRIVEGRTKSEWISAAAVWSWLLNPLALTHAHSGLETMLFTCGIILVLYEWMREETHTIRLGLACLFVALCRPEGLILGIGIAAVDIFSRSENLRIDSKKVQLHTSFFLVPVISYHLWRLTYYGSLLSNTWHAKRHEGIINPQSFEEFGDFGLFFILPFVLGYFCLLFSIDNWKMLNKDFKRILIGYFPFILFGIITLIIYGRSRLLMGFSYRFFYPMLPVYVIGFTLLIWKGFTKRYIGNRFVAIGFLLGAFIFQLIVFAAHTKQEWYYPKQYSEIMDSEWRLIGERIAKEIPADKTVACYQDAGLIPYLIPNKCYDFGRLNDKYLASSHRPPEAVAEYFFELQPDVAVFTSLTAPKYEYYKEGEYIVNDPRFADYQLIKIYSNPNKDYHQFLYYRKDLD